MLGDLRPLTYYCTFPCRSCQCFVCRRQPPPSPLLLPTPCFDSHSTWNFELLTDTTYDLYLFAVKYNRVSRRRLLQPEFPFIRIVYGSDRPDRRRHRHCTEGDGSWQGHATTTSAPISKRSRLVEFREQLCFMSQTAFLSPRF